MKRFIKKHINLLFVFIVSGIFFTSIGVTATTIIDAINVSYSNTTTTKTNVQDAIDELYSKITWNDQVQLGDYIQLTPDLTSYTISSHLDSGAGYEGSQTINPRELNLWRVIRINADNTIDIVSEYTSSSAICFVSLHGYKNYIGILNELADAYKNSKYTIRARHMGYDNQTEYISSELNCSVSTNYTYDGEYFNESIGCGDYGFVTDVRLVENAIGTLCAYTPNSKYCSWYLIAGRMVDVYDDKQNYYPMQYFNRSIGFIDNLYDGIYDSEVCGNIRPILTLKSQIRGIEGRGTSSNPYILN